MGADVALDGARARDHPRRRPRDPLAAAPARDRDRRSGSPSRPGIAVIAATGHEMTARWHLGPITGFEFWRVARPLARGPDLPLLHDHRPEDDAAEPDGAPRLRRRRRAAGGAPDRAAEDGVLDEGRAARRTRGRLRVRPLVELARSPTGSPARADAWAGRPLARRRSAAARCLRRRSLVLAGLPARPRAAVASAARVDAGALPRPHRPALEGRVHADRPRARRSGSPATSSPTSASRPTRSRTRDKQRATEAASGARLQRSGSSIGRGRHSRDRRARRHVERLQLELEPAVGQERRSSSRRPTARSARRRTRARRPPSRSEATIRRRSSRRSSSSSRAAATSSSARAAARPSPSRRSSAAAPSSAPASGGVRLVDVARARRDRLPATAPSASRTTPDVTAMMGGGVCWLDIDNDGWLDLFAVNSYAIAATSATGRSTAACPAARSSTTSRASSPTSAARRAPTSSCAATAASPATSTATAAPTSTSPPPATTRCSGTTATATSARAPALRGSPPGAGTRAPRSPT